MNNFYSNDLPPYSGKIYKIFNIENIFFKIFGQKKISKHTTFLMAISDAYTQKTVFLVGNTHLRSKNLREKIYIYANY